MYWDFQYWRRNVTFVFKLLWTQEDGGKQKIGNSLQTTIYLIDCSSFVEKKVNGKLDTTVFKTGILMSGWKYLDDNFDTKIQRNLTPRTVFWVGLTDYGAPFATTWSPKSIMACFSLFQNWKFWTNNDIFIQKRAISVIRWRCWHQW